MDHAKKHAFIIHALSFLCLKLFFYNYNAQLGPRIGSF
jgi:hypothetical protein